MSSLPADGALGGLVVVVGVLARAVFRLRDRVTRLEEHTEIADKFAVARNAKPGSGE